MNTEINWVRMYLEKVRDIYVYMDTRKILPNSREIIISNAITNEIYAISHWHMLSNNAKNRIIQRYYNKKSKWGNLIRFHPHLAAQVTDAYDSDFNTYLGQIRHNVECISRIQTSMDYYEIQSSISAHVDTDKYIKSHHETAMTMLKSTKERYEGNISSCQKYAFTIVMGTHHRIGEHSLFIDIPDDIIVLIMNQLLVLTSNK